MGATMPAILKDSDIDAIASSLFRKLCEHGSAHQAPTTNSDQLIAWEEVAQIDADMRGPRAKRKVRQSIWKLVRAGIISKPIRINARVAKWRRGTVVAELSRHYYRNKPDE